MKKIFLALLIVAGCANTSPPAGAPERPTVGSYPTGLDNTCDGERYGTLVGQDAETLERILILRMVRINRPGSVSTQDYRPERINFDIGADNRIARITCG